MTIQISITDQPAATMLDVIHYSDGHVEVGNLEGTVIASADLPPDATDDEVRACVKHMFTALGERVAITRSTIGPVEPLDT